MNPEYIWAVCLFVAVILTAVAVNRFAPAYRSRLRRVVILFVVYALSLAMTRVLAEVDQPVWAARFQIATELLRALSIVNLGGMIVFTLLLRSVGIVLPMIASDLIVGLAYIVTTVGVFSQHGLDPVGAVATGAVVSAVLAISLQSTLGNILGGVALQLDGSIHEGDWIQLENGKQGKVRAIRWRHTLVETRDWSTIVVPNAQLLQNNITILAWRDGGPAVQRMWVWFNVDFRYAPTHVIQVVTDGLHGSPIENVAPEPKPNCVCMDFAKDGRDSFASYAVRYWIIDLATDDPTNSRVRARIYTALKRANIPLATPAVANLVQLHDRVHDETHQTRESNAQFNAVKTVHLFKSLNDDELRVLADGMSPALYAAGETITRQGNVAHWLYILCAGSVEVRANIDPDGAGPSPTVARIVATLQAPEVFGEMGLMTGEPRTADVVAKTEVECLRLGKPAFERVLQSRPEIASELAEKLASRRVGLIAVRDNLDEAAHKLRHARERDRILGGIKQFFGLSA